MPHELFLQSTDMPSPGLTLRCLLGISKVLTLARKQSLLKSETHFLKGKLGFHQLKILFWNNSENVAQHVNVSKGVTIGGKKSLNSEKKIYKPMFIPLS